jgi:hypothetical protein
MTDSTTLTFNGSQHVLITMPDEFHTQAEDVTLRFRTTRPLGLLLTTNTEQSADRLKLALMGGRVRLMAKLDDKEKVGRHPDVNICAISDKPVMEIMVPGIILIPQRMDEGVRYTFVSGMSHYMKTDVRPFHT